MAPAMGRDVHTFYTLEGALAMREEQAARLGIRHLLYTRLEVEDGRYVARPVGGPGSHLLVGLAQANAFVVVPEDVGHVAAGEAVTVMVLERRLG